MSKNMNFPYLPYFTKFSYVTIKLMNRNIYYIIYITSFIPFLKNKRKKIFYSENKNNYYS